MNQCWRSRNEPHASATAPDREKELVFVVGTRGKEPHMFKGEYEHRSHRQNVALAGALALVAGMVNAIGFLRQGVFTSHITGHAGQLSLAITLPSDGTLWSTAAPIAAFFFGAVAACLAIEGTHWQNKPYIYSLLLVLEASLLLTVLLISTESGWNPLALFVAMGLQNGLVTRLSGAVVRTTHLTGVVTDLGIEAARWGLMLVSTSTHWGRGSRASKMEGTKPSLPKSLLLLTIFTAFLFGGVLGSWLFERLAAVALSAPIALLLLGGALAFRNGMESLGPANRK